EFLAIVIANIYGAEKGATSFVANHVDPVKDGGKWVFPDPDGSPDPKGPDGTTPMPALAGTDAENFLTNPQQVDETPLQLMDMFKVSQPSLYCALALLPDTHKTPLK